MSNLGFLLVYRVLDQTFGVHVERATLPEKEDEAYLKRTGKPVLTLESLRGLREFDVILFSLSFENDYTNVVKILTLSGIPPHSEERDTRFPLIGAGGVAPMINPEPLAPCMDFFGIGEGEGFIDDIITSLIRGKDSGHGKNQILDSLARIPGVYIPDHFDVRYDSRGKITEFKNRREGDDRIIPRKTADLSSHRLFSPITTPQTELSDMCLVEVERGCPFGCAFCVASPLYGPVRMRPHTDIEDDFSEAFSLTEKIGLLGPAVSAHPHFPLLLRTLHGEKKTLGLPSLRTELVSDKELKLFRDLKVKTITLAPEAGSEDLRRRMGKPIPDEQFLDLAEQAADFGILHFRLYFLVGLPKEADEDIGAIADFAKRIKHVVLKKTAGKGKAMRLTLSLTPLVPKPHTPLMWMGMEEPKSLSRKIRAITSPLKKVGGISVIAEPPKWSYIQALISRGDRRVFDIIRRAASLEDDWKSALRETSINPDFYVLRTRERDELFPWDFINYGLNKDNLYRRYQTIFS
jgi:radical SAM superfamily enzyme YgiQ (UPF0313 family)